MTAKASVIVVLDGDALRAEHYVNGARIATPLPEGQELATLRALLYELRAKAREAAAHAARAEAQAALERSRRVRSYVALRHPTLYAKAFPAEPTKAKRAELTLEDLL